MSLSPSTPPRDMYVISVSLSLSLSLSLGQCVLLHFLFFSLFLGSYYNYNILENVVVIIIIILLLLDRDLGLI